MMAVLGDAAIDFVDSDSPPNLILSRVACALEHKDD
jgi:hypothetical protein